MIRRKEWLDIESGEVNEEDTLDKFFRRRKPSIYIDYFDFNSCSIHAV